MTTTKNTFFNFVAVSLLAITAGTYNIQSSPINLSLLAGSSRTLGSLLASTINGHTSFHFPNTPQFRHFYDFTAPRRYGAFYTTNTGKITLGGFVRFTEQGHTLFEKENDRKEYKKALADAIWAHKNYQARPSAKRKAELITTENHVYFMLNKVPLSPSNCRQLEDILSKAPSSGFSWLSLLFPWRSQIEVSPFGQEVTINRGHLLTEPLRICGRTLLYSLYSIAIAGGANAIIYASTPRSPLTTSLIALPSQIINTGRGIIETSLTVGGGSFAACCLSSLLLSFTNYNLAPEPTEGVRVAIHHGLNPPTRATLSTTLPATVIDASSADEDRVLRITSRGISNDFAIDDKNKHHTK